MYEGLPFLIFGLIFGFFMIIRHNTIAAEMEKALEQFLFYKFSPVTLKVFVILFGLIAIGFGVGVYCLLLWD